MSLAAALDEVLEPLSQCLHAESAKRVVEMRVSEPV